MQHVKTVIFSAVRATRSHSWSASTASFSRGGRRATAFVSSPISLHSAEEFAFHISTTYLLAPFSPSLLHLLTHLPQSPAWCRSRCHCASECASKSARAMQVASQGAMTAFCLPKWYHSNSCSSIPDLIFVSVFMDFILQKVVPVF